MIYTLFMIPFTVFSDVVNQLVIYIVLPLVFLYSLFTSFNIIKNRYIFILILLVMWSGICAIGAMNVNDYTARVLNYMILSVMFCYSIYAISNKNKKYIKWFYFLILAYYIACWCFALLNLDLLNMDISTQRLGADPSYEKTINANRFGYFTLFLTFAVFIFGELTQNQRWRKIFRVLFLLSIIIIIINAIVAGSRQVFLLNIPLYFILVSIRYIKKISKAKVMIYAILTIMFFYIGNSFLMPLYDTSMLKQRFEMSEYKDDYRMTLTEKAITYGTENPFFGIGPGNFQQKEVSFSHNSYTEIFAETGFVGLFLYCSILVSGLYVQLKRYILTKDKVFLFFSIYLIFYILDNMFYVFYEWYLLMGLFYLILVHSDSYYKNYYFNKIKSRTFAGSGGLSIGH